MLGLGRDAGEVVSDWALPLGRLSDTRAYDWSIEFAPAVVNALAGGSRAQRRVIAEMLGKVPSH